MIKTFKYKLYRSKNNKFLNEQTKIAGNIYNHCIALKYRYYKMYGKSLPKFKLQKHITKLKKLDKYSFWNEIDAQAIQEITDRIEKGYKAFFDNCKKETKTRKVSPPSFKKARGYQSFTLKQTGYKTLDGNKIRINKRIYKYWKSRELEGEIKCVNIKKDKLGDWYISFVCECEENSEETPMTGKTAGFDFGCMTFLTQNNGNKIKSPEFFKKNRKQIAKANRVLSIRTKGSSNYKDAKRRLAKLHKKIANQRKDFQFKLANTLFEEYDIVFFETLNLESMKKEHGKKINDLGFSDFVKIMEHKSEERGKQFHCINQWFASTKTCNCCGYKNESLTQRDRQWACPKCNEEHDRDINAAKNIHLQGTKEILEELNNLKDYTKISKDGASSCWREGVRLDESQPALAIA